MDLRLRLSYQSLRSILLNYGLDVMETQEFREAFLQEHHYTTTVAEHSINVAVIGIILCVLLMKMHVKVDVEMVVHAALCHDLGIMGREGKYKSEFECCMKHPVDSVKVASCLFPEWDEKTLKCIETHMWPARPGRPRSVEGYVITLADKYACVMECTHRSTTYHCRNIVFSYATI